MPDDAPDPTVLDQVRRICLDLPEAVETTQFHGTHIVFQAGTKTFVYLGATTIAFKTEPGEAEHLLSDPRFERTAYIGQHGWVTLHIDRAPLDWDEVEDLLVTSYRRAALKRMVRALDARGG